MLGVLFEYHYLAAVPELTGRPRTLNEQVRQLQLQRFLESVPNEREGRVWRRLHVGEEARLVTPGWDAATVVHEASVGGFRVSGRHDLIVRDFVELHAGGFVFPCRVVWWSLRLEQYGLSLVGLPRAVGEPIVSA